MSGESSRCYEVLGVKPGLSVAELKAAYRDLAKVWQPDRFGHDLRLQQKAQKKLKEINEAYEQAETNNRNVGNSRVKTRSDSESETAAKPTTADVAAEVRPIPTVTVLIDSSTCLLARSDCPTRTRMTYPTGNEPHGYCAATHSGKSKESVQANNSQGDSRNESRVKSIAKHVLSPGKWLGGADVKEKKSSDTKDQ